MRIRKILVIAASAAAFGFVTAGPAAADMTYDSVPENSWSITPGMTYDSVTTQDRDL